ncbi:winged helix-turn-helix domain-containing protein [Serratia fonticola]|uniref:winged helix-turn-helix domain-containing protein n=1 Tax=Serratia fonticola TaxID=47917 RepID=UPI0021BAF004|nr:winged helix-turn-helix domain-containing protein [Serratia fonticola]
MKYKLNDRIIFDVDSGTLSLSDLFDDTVTISNPSKRLLQLLIVHQGDAVSREVIFKKVWDDYGMISSNNNLNQCVSKLRRVIKALGIDEEVIVTVPKVGFMLHSEIQIVSCEDEKDTPILDAEPPVSAAKTIPEVVGKVFSCASLRYGWGIVGFVCVVLAGIAFYIFNPSIRQESYLGKSGNCAVFMSNSTVRADPAFSDDVLVQVARQKIQCQPDEYLLLMRGNQVKSYISGISRLFFLRCKILREHKIELCSGLESESSL